MQPFLTGCPLQSGLQARQFQLLFQYLPLSLLKQPILGFMPAEHIEQKRGADLQWPVLLLEPGKPRFISPAI